MRTPYARKGNSTGAHTAAHIARREVAIEQALAVLAAGPLLTVEVGARMGIPARTAYGYLQTLGARGGAHQIDSPDHDGRKLWAAGERASETGHSSVGARALVVPARQVGMHRDPLVSALFGPAQHAQQ